MIIDDCISPPQYDLLDLRGPDSGIYALLQQAEDAEERTLLFKRNRQYEAEGTGHKAEGIGHGGKGVRE